jgi:hypothetical protein
MKEAFVTNQDKISIERSNLFSEIAIDGLKLEHEDIKEVDPNNIYTPKFSVWDLIGKPKKK